MINKQIEIKSNKVHYVLLSIIILILAGVSVYAIAVDKTDKWHSSSGIEVTIGGIGMSLQDAIDNGYLSGNCSISGGCPQLYIGTKIKDSWLWSEGTGEIYYIGDVGIGTSSPGEKLDVNGNVLVSGNLIIEDWLVFQHPHNFYNSFFNVYYDYCGPNDCYNHEIMSSFKPGFCMLTLGDCYIEMKSRFVNGNYIWEIDSYGPCKAICFESKFAIPT